MRYVSFAATIFLVSLLVSGCGGSSGNDTTGSTTGDTTGSTTGGGTTDNTVTSISVSPSPGSFTQANQTLQLSASAFNSSGQSIGFNPSWSSSNNTVATVSASGLVTSQSNGTATITVSSGGISETVTVSVDIPDTTVASITITPPAGNFDQAGQTLQLSASAFNAAGQIVESSILLWSSSNSSVATVNSSGLVTAVSNGSTSITASSNGVGSSASISVAIPIPSIMNDDGDIPGSNFYLSNNNSARLSGSIFGNGTSIDQNIHKQLIKTKSSSNSELLLKQVYATVRPSSLTEIIGVVQNTSQQTRCAARIDGLETRDMNGLPTSEQPFSFTFIRGSSGFLPAISSNTTGCLQPNELAYFSTLSLANFNEVEEFNFDTLEFGFTSSTSVTIPSTGVIPLFYTTDGSEISIRIVNQHSTSIEVTRVSIFLLNTNGFPLLSDSISVDRILTPGEEINVSDEISFNGSSTIIRAVVDIDDP